MSVLSLYKSIVQRFIRPLSPSLHPSVPPSLRPSFPLSLLLSLVLSFNLYSQQPTNCLQRLVDAESLFQTGIFEDIPDILEDCLRSYEPQEKQRALKLIALSRYMNDDITGAEETMRLLLKEFPLFKPDASDPIDFQFVYNEFKVRRLFDIGIFAGSGTAWGIITEPWSPFADEFTYAPGFPGYDIGSQISFHIIKNLVINSQPALSSYKFRIHYDSSINGILDLKQSEQQTLIELPLNVQVEFLQSHIKPYFKLGGTIGFLISSNTKSSIERYDPTYDETIFTSGDIINDHKEYRNNLIFFAGGGIGLNIDFNKYRLFTELNYHQSLNEMLKKGSNRYDQESLWTEGWYDSDLRINKVSLRVGFVKSFYWIKKRKQEII
jgi:hypothetical protein